MNLFSKAMSKINFLPQPSSLPDVCQAAPNQSSFITTLEPFPTPGCTSGKSLPSRGSTLNKSVRSRGPRNGSLLPSFPR